MTDYFYNFAKNTELPADAVSELENCFIKIKNNNESEFDKLTDIFYESHFDRNSIVPQMKETAQSISESFYTISGLFLICSSERIRRDFLAKGYPEKVFWDTMCDIKYKLCECKTVKGVWGNFTENWYKIFYTLDLFKLGRLEYQRFSYPESMPEYDDGKNKVNYGDLCYNVHIPSCGPLTKELRMESYKLAYDFFADELKGKNLVCVCHSWLLYGKNREILTPKSNIYDFIGDWNIIKNDEDNTFRNCWRLFGKDYDGNADSLPRDTSTQRAFADWLKNGNKTGVGFGVMVFDGKNIVNKQ